MYVVLCGVLFLGACSKENPQHSLPVEPSGPTEPVVRLMEMKILQFPDRLAYPVGYAGELDLTGLKVEGRYSDGTRQLLVITTDQVFGFASDKVAENLTLTIRIGEVETEFDVQIYSEVLTQVEDNGTKTFRVPDYIREIASAAFQNTQYEEVILNEGLERIGEKAFMFTPVVKIHFPKSLKVIENQAFYGCTRLEQVDLAHTSVKVISNEAFYNSGLRTVKLPLGLEEIKSKAFMGTVSLEEMDFPSMLHTIESMAFRESGVRKVKLPAGLRMLGKMAFMECKSLERVTSSLEHAEQTNEANGFSDSNVFESCPKLRILDYPENIVKIGRVQLSDSPQLERLTLGSRVQMLGFSAFNNVAQIQLLEIKSEIPPVLDIQSLPQIEKIKEIRVPATSLERYVSHEGWTSYRTIIKGE